MDSMEGLLPAIGTFFQALQDLAFGSAVAGEEGEALCMITAPVSQNGGLPSLILYQCRVPHESIYRLMIILTQQGASYQVGVSLSSITLRAEIVGNSPLFK